MSKKMVPSRSSLRAANQLDGLLVALEQRRQQIGHKRLASTSASGISVSSGMRRGMKLRVLRGLDDEGQLHGRRGHLDGRLGALVLRSVHNVGPVNQLGHRRGVKAEARGRDVRQKAGAGGVFGIEKLARGADRVLLAGQEVLVILRREKRRKMMIEPPGDPRRGRVFEIDDGVFVAGKLALVEERAGAMHQPVILVAGVRRRCTRGGIA